MPSIMTCPRCWGAQAEPGNANTACTYCRGGGALPDVQLSPHFRLSELLASQTAIRRGIPNDPSPAVLTALTSLATDLLEPLRERVGAMHVDSGYRSPPLNDAVGGASRSAHVTGFAADLKPLAAGVSLRHLMASVLDSGLVFDQVIWEYGSWVHVGLRGPEDRQRNERLMIFSGTGYVRFDGRDPRVPQA